MPCSSASNIIGVKKTGDLLEKLTWGFIITIMVLCLSTNLITPNTSSGNELIDRAGEDAPVNNTVPVQSTPSEADTTGN